MKRLPPLNALRAFEVAGRHLNFRLAADELGVTHGAVAQHIRALEARLGLTLFERLPRGVALTDVGRVYLATIRRALEMIADATEELSPRQAVLKISVTPSFATKWLVPRLGMFSDANPEIDVRVEAKQELANFQSDGIDIAVRQAVPPFGPGLVAELLFVEEFYAVCSPKLLKGERAIRSPKDLSLHALLHDAHGLWPIFLEQVLEGHPIPNFRSMNFSQTSLAVDAAIAGQGVALVSDLFVADEITKGRLCRLFDHSITGEAGFFAVTPRKPRNFEAVNRMKDWLISQAKSDQSND